MNVKYTSRIVLTTSPVCPRCAATRLDEQAVSVLMHGPCRPRAYDTRPTRNGSVLPVLLTAAEGDSPAAART